MKATISVFILATKIVLFRRNGGKGVRRKWLFKYDMVLVMPLMKTALTVFCSGGLPIVSVSGFVG